MRRAKNIVRLAFLFIAVSLLVYLNRDPEDMRSVAEFKVKMFEKVRKDSLDTGSKLVILAKGTSHFVDSSSRVKEGILYVTWLFGFIAITELTFIILRKGNNRATM